MTVRKRCHPERPFCTLNPLDAGGLSKSFLSVCCSHPFFSIEAGSKSRFVVVEDKYINKPWFSFSFFLCMGMYTCMYTHVLWRVCVEVRG